MGYVAESELDFIFCSDVKHAAPLTLDLPVTWVSLLLHNTLRVLLLSNFSLPAQQKRCYKI